MKPYKEIARTTTPDGAQLILLQHSEDYYIEVNGDPLMSTRATGSERALAELAIRALGRTTKPCLLIGGLGLGFTLGAALDLLPRGARVVVSEVLEPVVEWNRRFRFESSRDRLADPRVVVQLRDVVSLVQEASNEYDAILLDVDNGPDSFTIDTNYRLYTIEGLALIRRALRPGGVLAVWSAQRSNSFERKLRKAGFQVEATTARSRARKGSAHTIFLGRLPAARS